MNYFEKLYQVDVSEHIEQKGKFNYLSWTFAIEQLGKLHPEAIIKTKVNESGFPAFYAPNGQALVWITVEIDNVVRGQPYPVLDYRNQAVDNPDIFTINTSLQRALVKAIALHGLGLWIFSGEDLPPDAPHYTKEQKTTFDKKLGGEPLDFWLYLQIMPNETKLALYSSFEKGSVTAKKKQARDLESKGSILFADLTSALKDYIDSNDEAGVSEISMELGDTGKRLAFKQLNAEQQHNVKQLMGAV